MKVSPVKTSQSYPERQLAFVIIPVLLWFLFLKILLKAARSSICRSRTFCQYALRRISCFSQTSITKQAWCRPFVQTTPHALRAAKIVFAKIFGIILLFSYQCCVVVFFLSSVTTHLVYHIFKSLSTTFLFYFFASSDCFRSSLSIIPWLSLFVNHFFNLFYFFERRKRDLNPRAALATYTLSRGASSASWVFLRTFKKD